MTAVNDGKPLKGLVLAAGLGTRLRPLTLTLPKPLATVCGVTLLDSAIDRLILAGASDIAINSHHLPDVLRRHIEAASSPLFQMNFQISLETPDILGTGGALVPLKAWWGESPLLVYNGDILSDMDLKVLVQTHGEDRPLVSLAVRDVPPEASAGRSVWVDKQGYVQKICKREDLDAGLLGLRECGYACAYVAEPGLRKYLPAKAVEYDLIAGFNAALDSRERIRAVDYNGFWADIGTPKSLWETNLLVAAMPETRRRQLLGRGLTPSSCIIRDNNVLPASTQLASARNLSGCVFLGDASSVDGEILKNHLRGFGFDHNF